MENGSAINIVHTKLYHGSPTELNVLIPKADHGDPKVNLAVFQRFVKSIKK